MFSAGKGERIMALFGKPRAGGFMDEIRCDEPSYLIWKWHPQGSRVGYNNRENAIRWGSSLRVKDGEVAMRFITPCTNSKCLSFLSIYFSPNLFIVFSCSIFYPIPHISISILCHVIIYSMLCIKESYSSRELERQINSGYYERYMLSQEKLLPEPIKGLKDNPFLDSYIIEFLDLPKNFKESDLRKGLIQNMKDFILEVGKDFTFIDEEYRVQVGGEDFRIDLLFFHRGLQCLVAFELKIGKFKPEYISKMDFYLEALDRQKKKENENPSVGVILFIMVS